ncbi:MAG: ribosomal-protein-alanine N-acetyltransferase [Chloroflexi bacterium ADurb.Bin325]|nr:MAG: ribosomal-protein-alanine N-acetyltransferase [Chloroflexi bacterium ADurb.Bin325]
MTLPCITPMTLADLDDIMPLERRVFKDPWTRRMYHTDLTDNYMATYLVLRPDPQGEPQPRLPRILGWGGFWLMVDEAHISTIAAHPDWRGCGLGQWLMVALMWAAQERGALHSTLEVRVSNTPARMLYEKLGYGVTGQRRRYYRDGEDGLIMTTPPLADAALQARLAAAYADALARAAGCIADPPGPAA